MAVGLLLCHFVNFIISFEKIPYSLVEARRKNVLAHAARFCRASARIVYASSFLRFRISLGLFHIKISQKYVIFAELWLSTK